MRPALSPTARLCRNQTLAGSRPRTTIGRSASRLGTTCPVGRTSAARSPPRAARAAGGERGYALIIALVAVLVLTLLATRVMQTVSIDVDLARMDKSGQGALAIADAGIAWGIDRLRGAPFNLDQEGADLDAALDANLAPPITAGTSGCPDTSCPLFGWHQLTSGPQAFAGGTYLVAVSDDDETDGDPAADTNGRILLRSLGTDASGARRLIEAALTNE